MTIVLSGADGLTNAEAVHRIFRGATEYVKWLKVLAMAAEVIAAMTAGVRTMAPDLSWSPWASLGLAVVLITGIALRLWARIVGAHAERCRRVSVRAYGKGQDISAALAHELKTEAPILTERLAATLPAQSLAAYYEVTTAPGQNRLREIYAHSAFYTWQLLRSYGRIQALLAVAITLIGVSAIYSLASAPMAEPMSGRVLDLVCSFVFVFIAGRATQAAIESLTSFRSCRDIYEDLISAKRASDIGDLCVEYDVERSSGITIPTALYKRRKDALQEDWHAVRASIF